MVEPYTNPNPDFGSHTKKKEKTSSQSLAEANRERGEFSRHRGSKGSAGYIDPDDAGNADFLGRNGDSLAASPPAEGFGEIVIAAAWDTRVVKDQTFWGRMFKREREVDIDLDLGCLYELQDGHRGAIQALGSQMGNMTDMPYMALTGDERTGRKSGDDEAIHINGAMWPKIKRLLVYVYIYRGAIDWAQVRPQIQVRIPGLKPMVVTLATHHKQLEICAIGGLENVRNGIKLTNHTEYFHGHAEMDRAYGFGLEWDSGSKAQQS